MFRRYTLAVLPLFKHCPRCSRLLEYTEFWISRFTTDGLYYACKACSGRCASERDHRRSQERAHQKPWASRECTRCRHTLPADCFSRSTRHRSGLYSYCKPCENARQRGKRAARKA